MKLIKIGEEFYLTNKQEIKIGDVTLQHNKGGDYYYMPKIVMEYQLNDNSGIKVIASTNNLGCDIFSLDKDSIKKTLGIDETKKYSIADLEYVFEHAVNAALNSLHLKESGRFNNESEMRKYRNSFLKAYTEEQSEWDVEIQMRSKNIDKLRESKEGFLNNPNLNVPVIENGYIKIIKIISNETN
jgi:hypothetical protein